MNWKTFALMLVGFGLGSLAYAIMKQHPPLRLAFWVVHIDVWLAAFALMSHFDKKRSE